MSDRDCTDSLRERIARAAEAGRPLCIEGHGSKRFYGGAVTGETLSLDAHTGIVDYEPTELVVIARSGTPLDVLESLLAEHGQMLAFEPPRFSGRGTIGGAVASGLAGPRRPWGGAPRDLVLGVRMLDGRGQDLRFGGRVMKNVAGYDVSRLMAGSLGTLGVLLEISLKVLPAPAATRTRVLELSRDAALERIRELARRPCPLSGACHHEGLLYLRLSGAEASVEAWSRRIGGEPLAPASTFWERLRDHRLDFFERPGRTLWRLSLPPATPRLGCEHDSLLDWGGAQRWVFSEDAAATLRSQVSARGGHAEVFRRGEEEDAPFQSLPGPLLALHRRLKARFDPHGILEPGRLPGLDGTHSASDSASSER